jgi:hypothetical protein
MEAFWPTSSNEHMTMSMHNEGGKSCRVNFCRRVRKETYCSGFTHRSPGKRAKSRSAVCNTPPHSIVRAAISASLTRDPDAWPSITMVRNSRQYWSPGASTLTFGCPSHSSTACRASAVERRYPGTRGSVAIRTKAAIVCQGSPTVSVPDNAFSSQVRALAWCGEDSP